MVRVLKVLLWLVVVIVVVVVGAYAFVPGSFLKNQAQQAIADATGRDVTIDGLALKRWAPIGFTVSGVTIGNAPWAEDPALATVETIEADVNVLSLITGASSPFVLTVQKPEIFIEIDEDGRGNFEFETASGEGERSDRDDDDSEPGDGGDFELPVRPEIRIENGVVFYRDRAQGVDRQFENINLAITQESEAAPLILKGNVDSDGQSATLDGTVASLDSLASGAASDIDVKATAPGLNFALTGSVDPTAQRTDSKLDLQVANPRELANWLGQPLEIPEPALSNLSVTANIAGGAESVEVSDLVLKLDDIEGQGMVAADMSGERPAVTTKITFGDVDLT
ncbi:MAG: AsmA family protein, partial [Pseudomonadota bacterium]